MDAGCGLESNNGGDDTSAGGARGILARVDGDCAGIVASDGASGVPGAEAAEACADAGGVEVADEGGADTDNSGKGDKMGATRGVGRGGAWSSSASWSTVVDIGDDADGDDAVQNGKTSSMKVTCCATRHNVIEAVASVIGWVPDEDTGDGARD